MIDSDRSSLETITIVNKLINGTAIQVKNKI